MQPAEALVGEGARLRPRIGVEGGRLRHVAFLEAHAMTVLQVDGGKKDHRLISMRSTQASSIALISETQMAPAIQYMPLSWPASRSRPPMM